MSADALQGPPDGAEPPPDPYAARTTVGRPVERPPLDQLWLLRERARVLGILPPDDGDPVRKVVGRPA